MLFAKILQVGEDNAAFICSFGSALNESKVKQEADESDRDFVKRVRLSRKFVRQLNEIQECKPPAVIRIDRDSKPALERGRQERDQRHNASHGGGGNSTGSTPSSPPAPAGGGGTQGGGNTGGGTTQPPPPDNPPPPSNPPVSAPPEPEEPPQQTGLLDPVTDSVPGVDCHLNVLGVQVCN